MTKQEADKYLADYVKEKCGHVMRCSEIADFGLTGEEDKRDIEQYADDYISECETDEAEYRTQKQDEYNDRNEYAIVQSERCESFRNEY